MESHHNIPELLNDSHLVEHAFFTLWTIEILEVFGSCSLHFAISIWTLTKVAVRLRESSKNFQRYRSMSDVSATNLQSLFESVHASASR